MPIFIAILLLVGITFSFGSLSAAPWVPIRQADVERVIDLIKKYRQPSARLVELGSGDGRLLSTATKHGFLATGAVKGLCPYYGQGLGSSITVLARQPVLAGLLNANDLLASYNRELVVVDAWRSAKVQAALWRDVLLRIVADPQVLVDRLSLVKFGLQADDIGSYAPVQKDSEQYRTMTEQYRNGNEAGAQALGLTPEEFLHLYVTFESNLAATSPKPFLPFAPLDESGNTAHGNGGATDLYLINIETGNYTCLGVPFDYVGEESKMDYFEDDANYVAYAEKVNLNHDPLLNQYLRECGIDFITPWAWETIRNERRLLTNACVQAGATFYNGEPWHFNWGNAADPVYPGAGSGCHSLLKNVLAEDGQYVAVWGNQEAHIQAREILGT